MKTAHVDFKVGSRYPFKLDAPEDKPYATWRLNATAIGRMGRNVDGQRESLDRANTFINKVAQAVAIGRVPGDPSIKLAIYEPGDKFSFAAEVMRSDVSPDHTQTVAEASVLHIAKDLAVEEEPQVHVAQRGGTGPVRGLNIAVGNATLKTHPYDDMFELYARNIENDKQPLIFLMGVVAVAHADQLAHQ